MEHMEFAQMGDLDSMEFLPVGVSENDLVHRELPPACTDRDGAICREAPAPDDPVNHPAHYTQGKIECIEFIADKQLNFCRGNAVKYIVRAGHKDPAKEVEDLEKAVFYLNWEIGRLKREQGE